MNKQLLNLPNVLTLLRILLIPVFVWLYFAWPEKKWVALAVYIVAAFTDVLDGYLARRNNQITWFGKLFDPLADKLMTVAMLYCLVTSGEISGWVLAVFVLKELYMLVGASILLSKSVVVQSDWFGKAATIGFVLSTCLIYPWHDIAVLTQAGKILLYISLCLSIAAMIHYTMVIFKRREEIKM